MSSAYILAGCRTPIGKFKGGLSNIPAPHLAAPAISASLDRAGIAPDRVDEVILGNVLSAGLGQAPARQATLAAGLPVEVSALTINKMCGSGLAAVMLADHAIRLGEAEVIVAGGMECMSQAPRLLPRSGNGLPGDSQEPVDSMVHDGLTCAHEEVVMVELADYIATRYSVSRKAQDAFAAESHHRAAAAIKAGKFRAEVIPVAVGADEGTGVVEEDEGPRPDTRAVVLAELPAIRGDSGSVTAGNASQLSDGAATVVVADENVAQNSDAPLKARIVASATTAVRPKDLFIAPVTAVERVLAKARLSLRKIDLVELNEAFAAQALACVWQMDLNPEKVNIHGGAIALGHPIGASGARVLVTLLHALRDRGLRRGLATLCLGGGGAVAMVVEMV